MPSIIYNDDVEMRDSSYNQGSNFISSIWDRSTPSGEPHVDPIAVNDNTNRISDGWSQNTNPDGGSEGQVWPNVPPSEKDPLRYYVKTIREKTRIVVRDYSDDYLENLNTQGFRFYAVYTDGTVDEVDYTEIFDPHKIDANVVVNEAYDIANAINQHFWEDTNGAHVTDENKEDWDAAVSNNFSDLSPTKQYHNILINSLGMLLRSALNNLVSLSRSGMTIFDGLGNDLANVLASFTSEGASFREGGKTRAEITTQGLAVYDNTGSISNGEESKGAQVAYIGIDDDGKPYSRIGKSAKGYIEIGVNDNDNGFIDFYNSTTLLAHIGYDAGTNITGGISKAPYYSFGIRRDSSVIGNYSFAEGRNVTASGYASHAEGNETYATGSRSHAEGQGTTASGAYSHAEGFGSTASKSYAHAEGRSTASGELSHSEGSSSASGATAHAEGVSTSASGSASHTCGRETSASASNAFAGGYKSTASGESSFSFGNNTKADNSYCAAFGSYTQAKGDNLNPVFVCGLHNNPNTSNLFEVGNGSASSKANAFRVTRSNTAYVGSTVYSSDMRIKEDLGIISIEEAIRFIKFLIPRKYKKFGREELGFFAQEVEDDPSYGNILVEQYPDQGYDDFRSLNYNGMIAPMVSALQNALDRIEQLEQENEELKQQNQDLIERLNRIESMLGI